MVQAFTLLAAAALIVGPVLAAPHPHVHHKHIAADSTPIYAASSAVTKRSINNPDHLDIEAREPNPFNVKKAFRVVKGVAKVVKKVAPIALKAGSLFLARDEEGNLYVREPGADELVPLEGLERRRRLVRTLRRAHRAVGNVPVVGRIAATARSLGFRQLEDGEYPEEREVGPLDFVLEGRDFDELDERDPKSNFRQFAGNAKRTASKVLRVVDRVSAAAHKLGLRELDMDKALEAEVRSLDELD